MLESTFQSKLKKELQDLFPGALIFKNDAKQGLPDLLILYGPKWAALECKRSLNASHRPNQDYYVDKMGSMGFASFVCPENKNEVIRTLKEYFK